MEVKKILRWGRERLQLSPWPLFGFPVSPGGELCAGETCPMGESPNTGKQDFIVVGLIPGRNLWFAKRARTGEAGSAFWSSEMVELVVTVEPRSSMRARCANVREDDGLGISAEGIGACGSAGSDGLILHGPERRGVNISVGDDRCAAEVPTADSDDAAVNGTCEDRIVVRRKNDGKLRMPSAFFVRPGGPDKSFFRPMRKYSPPSKAIEKLFRACETWRAPLVVDGASAPLRVSVPSGMITANSRNDVQDLRRTWSRECPVSAGAGDDTNPPKLPKPNLSPYRVAAPGLLPDRWACDR